MIVTKSLKIKKYPVVFFFSLMNFTGYKFLKERISPITWDTLKYTL